MLKPSVIPIKLFSIKNKFEYIEQNNLKIYQKTSKIRIIRK